MKKNLLLLFIFLNILSYPLLAQKKSKTPTGFGIEAGLGYNTTKLTVKKPSGEDTTFSFIHVWFQPSIRLHYDIKLYQMGVNSVLKLKTLLGYYSFGGKLKPDKSGKSEVLTFGSIEAGVGLAFDVYHMFEITPMIKTQYIFSATDHLIISTPTTAKDLK